MGGRCAEGATKWIKTKVETKVAQICPAPRPVVTVVLSLLHLPAAVLSLRLFILER